MDDIYHVAVVGAGPAGSAAALAARRAGARVLLLDRSDFPRDKACGDGIAAHALDVLDDLGVADVVAGFPPVPALRMVGPGAAEVCRDLPRAAYTVPRRIFDARLVAAAVTRGAELRRHTVRRIDVRDDVVVIDGAFAARSMVGADGAGSVVRRLLGYSPNPPQHLALAIRGYAPALPGAREQHIITSGERWPAYAWSFPIGASEPSGSPWDGRANVGYGEVLRGSRLTRQHLVDRLYALLPGIDRVTDLRAHHLPLSTRRPPPGIGRVILAGDALSLINPFTGEGIFYAVLSGAIAGQVAASAGPQVAQRYASALGRRLGAHLRHSSTAAWLARRRSVVDAAVRAAARDRGVFDAVVELGLGDGRLDLRTLAHIARSLAEPGVGQGSAD